MLSFESLPSRETYANPFSPEAPRETEALESEIDHKSLDLDVLIRKHSEIRFDLNRAITKRNELWVALKNAQNDLFGMEAGSQYFELVSSNPKLKKSTDAHRINLIGIKKTRLDQQIQSAKEQICILDGRIEELHEQSQNTWKTVLATTKELNLLFEKWGQTNKRPTHELPHAA